MQKSTGYIFLTLEGIENPRVGGSIPPPGTTSTSSEVQPSKTILSKSCKINTISYFYVQFRLLQSRCSEGHNSGHLPFD
ncbi:hypothetical protein Xekk_04109 [Xenorhabdus sp. KK7.4]|nr:hypothetical protein Xekk_04109 [Xenorhabdus sp. KK7.4]